MSNYLKTTLKVFVLLLLVSCEEIINEINIENKTTVLTAPFEGASLMEGTVQFDWESMEGATNYRIQIARPNFENPEQLILNDTPSDSLTTTYQFTLTSGSYQWRVRGENGAYFSNYKTANLTIN